MTPATIELFMTLLPYAIGVLSYIAGHKQLLGGILTPAAPKPATPADPTIPALPANHPLLQLLLQLLQSQANSFPLPK